MSPGVCKNEFIHISRVASLPISALRNNDINIKTRVKIASNEFNVVDNTAREFAHESKLTAIKRNVNCHFDLIQVE